MAWEDIKDRFQKIEEEWQAWLGSDLTPEEVEHLERLVTLISPQPWGLYADVEVHKLAEKEGWFELEKLGKDLEVDGEMSNVVRFLMGNPHNTEELAMFYSGYHPGRANLLFVSEARRFLPMLIESLFLDFGLLGGTLQLLEIIQVFGRPLLVIRPHEGCDLHRSPGGHDLRLPPVINYVTV